MRLVHFAQKPTLRRPLESVVQVIEERRLPFKPRGLWVTPFGDEYDWSWWCRGEGYRLEDLRHAHEVRLRADARILVVDDLEAMHAFNQRFRLDYRIGVTLSERCIDWVAVARDYQGIVIAPYRWELRMDHDFFWYYTWDCASGCVWDATAVASVVYLPEVSVVTESEIRRSIHRRMRFTRRKTKKLHARLQRDMAEWRARQR